MVPHRNGVVSTRCRVNTMPFQKRCRGGTKSCQGDVAPRRRRVKTASWQHVTVSSRRRARHEIMLSQRRVKTASCQHDWQGGAVPKTASCQDDAVSRQRRGKPLSCQVDVMATRPRAKKNTQCQHDTESIRHRVMTAPRQDDAVSRRCRVKTAPCQYDFCQYDTMPARCHANTMSFHHDAVPTRHLDKTT